MDLFLANEQKNAPLADRMRPRSLSEFVGQEHILGTGKLLRRAIEADRLSSCIFYGPPGTGKSTLAEIIAATTSSHFERLNAVSAGVAEVRAVIERAKSNLKVYGVATFLLLDECHRWSKSQSDSMLPAIEKGIIRFIGSTTENPLIAMTPAIVSRCRLFGFLPLTEDEVKKAVHAALLDRDRGFGMLNVKLDDDALTHIVAVANGDVRCALNAIELAVLTTSPNELAETHVTLEVAEESIQKRAIRCDNDEYYNMLSAFCKSLRGSDSDAALFWFARMIYAGVDPRIIVRRMIAHSSEDVGMANSGAMIQATAAAQALEFNGMPEARLNIAQAIIYICESPKSNSVLKAVNAAFYDAENTYQEPVPVHLRDTSYKGAEKLGNGKGYKYVHDYREGYVHQQYMPDALIGKKYYIPSNQGNELKISNIKAKRE